ncbi:Vascular endothelial growth factor receptor 3 [Stylophora pistillata]|uniref:Vascular endothelial growth factor receptor 3 n=1 Tax=Stylophora pistillata TaxID=50429 RepID=A0A2B4RKF2_STYPI|nr:Vascular endothelial growth factor receptor 3 [Stylophora pistillata]
MFSPTQGQAVEMELSNVEVDEWEVEVNRVLLQEVIGRGAFGAVWRALLSSPNGRPGNRTVAAKCFTSTAGEEGRKCLMREIELGKIIGESNQPNIVKFIGCVTRQGKPTSQIWPNPHPILTPGDELALTCLVNDATVTITWKKDGDPIKVINKKLDEKTSELRIPKVVVKDSGEYSCEACNRLQNVARSTVTIYVNPVKVRSPSLVWYYIVGSMAAVIVILLVCWYFWKRRMTGQAVEMELSNLEVDEWEVEVNRVLLQEVIGRGAFGAVWRALLSSPNGRPGNRTVAAKCFTPTAGEEGRKCLMREIELGKIIGASNQPNIVKFIGCVTRQGGIPYDGWSEGNVVAQVTRGYKLPKPDHVDDKLYAIMKRCWNFNPDFRPPFENLLKRMDTYLREETYLHLLDMESYDTTKYSKVEDLGGEDAEPTARTTTNAAAKRLGKWASDRR